MLLIFALLKLRVCLLLLKLISFLILLVLIVVLTASITLKCFLPSWFDILNVHIAAAAPLLESSVLCASLHLNALVPAVKDCGLISLLCKPEHTPLIPLWYHSSISYLSAQVQPNWQEVRQIPLSAGPLFRLFVAGYMRTIVKKVTLHLRDVCRGDKFRSVSHKDRQANSHHW